MDKSSERERKNQAAIYGAGRVERDGMLRLLKKAHHAIALIQEGKRDGATMGHLSCVGDEIKEAIQRIEGTNA